MRPGLRPAGSRDPLDGYADRLRELPPGTSLLKRMLHADLTYYLPSDMLVKVDRMSMRHGLEVRVPFLDHRLVQWCLSLPSRMVLGRRGQTKRLLRAHVARTISPEVATRPKRGFSVPVGAALKGPLYDLLMDAVRDPRFVADGPLDPDGVERLAVEHRAGKADWGFELYGVLVLALWWRRWIAP